MDAYKIGNSKLVKEIESLKDMINTVGRALILTQGESSQLKDKCSKLKMENQQLPNQLANINFDIMSTLIKKRFSVMMPWMDKHWTTCSKNQFSIEENESWKVGYKKNSMKCRRGATQMP